MVWLVEGFPVLLIDVVVAVAMEAMVFGSDTMKEIKNNTQCNNGGNERTEREFVRL